MPRQTTDGNTLQDVTIPAGVWFIDIQLELVIRIRVY